MMRLVSYLLLFCALPVGFCHGAFDDDFTHARAMGMGEAYAAFGGDGDIILMNPAGIWQIPRQLAVTYASLYSGLDDGSSIQQQLASYAYQQSPRNAFGFAWKRLAVSHLYTEDLYALAYARHAELYKTTGEERTLRFAYTVGGSVRLLRWDSAPTVSPDAQLIEDLSGPPKLALDLGVLVYPSEQASVALVFQDLNQPDISSDQSESEERLPVRSRLGLSLNSQKVAWALDLLFKLRRTDLRMGMEWDVYPDHLKLRLGVQLQNLAWGANLMLGAGYSPTPAFRLDYAFMLPIQGVDSTWGSHRMSAVYDF